MVKRAIIQIDEEKCNGCGVCIPLCTEGALKVMNGKARLVSDVYCDGLGACFGACPKDAIRVIDGRPLPLTRRQQKNTKIHIRRRESQSSVTGQYNSI